MTTHPTAGLYTEPEISVRLPNGSLQRMGIRAAAELYVALDGVLREFSAYTTDVLSVLPDEAPELLGAIEAVSGE